MTKGLDGGLFAAEAHLGRGLALSPRQTGYKAMRHLEVGTLCAQWRKEQFTVD